MWSILSTLYHEGVRPLDTHRNPHRVVSVSLLVIAIVTGRQFDSAASANPSAAGVRFDVPQWIEGVEVSGGAGLGSDRLILLELPVSIIVDSFANSGIDQLVVEISPRGGSTMVVDYSPERNSAVSTPAGSRCCGPTSRLDRSRSVPTPRRRRWQ